MIKTYTTCLLTGKNFNPKKLSAMTGLQFYSPSEKGETDVYTKQVLSYGAASLPCDKRKISLDSMLQILIQDYGSMQLCGVEDIDLTLYLAYRGQCNWYLEPEQLKKILDLGIGLSITCYEDENLLKEPIEYIDSAGQKFRAYLNEEGYETHELID